MRKKLTQFLALLLFFSICLTYLPASASAAPTAIPEYGDVVNLGAGLSSEMAIRSFAEVVNHDGQDYLIVPATGGWIFEFKLTEYLSGKQTNGTWVRNSYNTGCNIPKAIVQNSKGDIYVSYSGGLIFVYNFATGASRTLSPGLGDIVSMARDEKDNMYIVGSNKVMKVSPYDQITPLFTSDDIYMGNSIVYGDGYLYLWGPTADGNRSKFFKIDPSNGKKVDEYVLEKKGTREYLSYIDGVIFAGTSAENGMIALDAATMEPIDVGSDVAINGIVTNPKDGKAYMTLTGKGLHSYNLATRKIEGKVNGIGMGSALVIRNAFLTGQSDCMAVMISGKTPAVLDIKKGTTQRCPDLVTEGKSYQEMQSICTGIAGTGATIYLGGFLTPRVGSYTMYADDPMNSQMISHGNSQTDNMITYKGKLYLGCYTGAHLVEYDPATNAVTELVSDIQANYEQTRLHGLTAGDDKIFFSTIPNTLELGGVVGWYDLKTRQTTVIRNLVPDQSIISLAYDENTKLLYGASSISGGLDSKATQTEAMLMVYDVQEKKLLGNFSVRNEANPNSELAFRMENGDKIPTYIAGIARDPNTGKFWGLVGQTLFTFEYNRAKNTLRIYKEWEKEGGGKKSYPTGTSLQWFPRNFLFDSKGYLYIMISDKGLMRFDVKNPSNNQVLTKDFTRRYCFGSDGNIYYTQGWDLRMIPITEVGVVEQTILAAKTTSQIQTARQYYELLSAGDKMLVNRSVYSKLVQLEGGNPLAGPSAVEQVEMKIQSIGVVTEDSELAIKTAREAYDALSDAEKAEVRNYDVLVAAEQEYASLTGSGLSGADLAVVSSMIAKIDGIGEVTLEKETTIALVRMSYDMLTAEQKEAVTNYDKLEAAEATLAQLKKGGTSGGSVVLVEIQIDAIGEVTIGSQAAIESARMAYDALTEEQKAQVKNAQVLFDAEAAYEALVNGGGSGTVIVIVVSVVVVLLAGGGVGAYLYMKKKKNTAETPAEAAPAEEAPAEEAPTEEKPTEETPAAEAPVENVP